MANDWSRRTVITAAAGAVLAASTQAMAQQGAPAGPAGGGQPNPGGQPQTFAPPGVTRLDPALDALIDADAKVETIMEGFKSSEGPLWVGGRDGFFLAADPMGNAIRRWSPRDGQSVWLQPSGFAGGPLNRMYREAGTNGMIMARGQLIVTDEGNRGLARIDLKTKAKTMLCRTFEGKRFNSPNDLVLARDGSIYFTDPPYGLTGLMASPWRELDFMGVFRMTPDGKVTVIDRTVNFPNGIALSPDGRTLYTTEQGVGWLAWTLDARGNPIDRRVWVDSKTTGIAGGDSLKVDAKGNMWTSSREGISVITPEGKRIGIISGGSRSANCAFGPGYLYICTGPKVQRVAVKVGGMTYGT